jgi:hypothetical protein
METEYKYCKNCGSTKQLEKHHRVFRSQCKPLTHCKYNIVYLCQDCHRNKPYAIHNKYGHELDLKLKLEFQQWLEETFYQERYTLEEIRKKLDISQNAVRSLSKLMNIDRGAYNRDDIIRVAMGGHTYTEQELKEKDVI